MKKFLHNIVERTKSMLAGRRGTVYQLSWDQSEVTLNWLSMENETGSVSFRWDSVLTVHTFKRDHYIYDCICLEFETPEGWIEIDEEMGGWDEFLDAVELMLPNFPPHSKWWHQVAVTAFETNHSKLWTRSQDEPPA